MTIEYSISERVQAGAAYLDTACPGWDERIVTGILDITSWSRCVLGQLYGGFSKGVEALGLDLAEVHDLGLDGNVHEQAAERTQAWRDLIAARRRERLTVPAELLAVPV